MGDGVKHFALLGAAGYIAPKHMEAIKHVGGELVAVCDPHDSVGVVDRYSKNCLYFREFERFERYLSTDVPVDYLVVCTPNYLHDSHAALGLRIGADVILEKPACVHTRNLDRLSALEIKYQPHPVRVWCVLQLRHSPIVQQLKTKYAEGYYEVDVKYYTPRGSWYDYSWKGDPQKSGWVVTNIGIHLFDLMVYLFGDSTLDAQILHNCGKRHASGVLFLQRATVRWHLSTDPDSLPVRMMMIRGEQSVDLSREFGDLHTTAYKEILAGNGVSLSEARRSLKITESLLDKYLERYGND